MSIWLICETGIIDNIIELGNKVGHFPPQKEKFKDFKHFSEQVTPLFGKCYYFKKAGSVEEGCYAKPIPAKGMDEATKNMIATWKEVSDNSMRAVLDYKGEQKDLPMLLGSKQSVGSFFTFESFVADLDYEINQRSATKRYYSSEEMRGLIITGVHTINALQMAKMNHGLVCRKTVVLAAQNSFTVFKFVYPGVMDSRASQLFTYPDLNRFSETIRDGITVTDANSLQQRVKIDVFFFGMLLLEACNLQNYGDRQSIDIHDLNNCLLTVKMQYDESIYRIIREMLIVKMEKRPDGDKLDRIVEGLFKNEIVARTKQQ